MFMFVSSMTLVVKSYYMIYKEVDFFFSKQTGLEEILMFFEMEGYGADKN